MLQPDFFWVDEVVVDEVHWQEVHVQVELLSERAGLWRRRREEGEAEEQQRRSGVEAGR